jgi:hypothetical protein
MMVPVEPALEALARDGRVYESLGSTVYFVYFQVR